VSGAAFIRLNTRRSWIAHCSTPWQEKLTAQRLGAPVSRGRSGALLLGKLYDDRGVA
jgi:hypothetical protein